MTIFEAIQTEAMEKTRQLVAKASTPLSADEALHEVFKQDPVLYQRYRQAAADPGRPAPERSFVPPGVEAELLKAAMQAAPTDPLGKGMEVLRQALQSVRLGLR